MGLILQYCILCPDANIDSYNRIRRYLKERFSLHPAKLNMHYIPYMHGFEQLNWIFLNFSFAYSESPDKLDSRYFGSFKPLPTKSLLLFLLNIYPDCWHI